MEKSQAFRNIGLSLGMLGKISFNPWSNLIGEKLSLIHILINLDDQTIKQIYK